MTYVVTEMDFTKYSTEELYAMHTTAFSEYYKIATQPCNYQKDMKFPDLEKATEKLNAITDELERRIKNENTY